MHIAANVGLATRVLWRQTKTRGSSIRPFTLYKDCQPELTIIHQTPTLIYSTSFLGGMEPFENVVHISLPILWWSKPIYIFRFGYAEPSHWRIIKLRGRRQKVQLVLELFSETAIYFDEWRMCASSKLHTWRLFTERGPFIIIVGAGTGIDKDPIQVGRSTGWALFHCL